MCRSCAYLFNSIKQYYFVYVTMLLSIKKYHLFYIIFVLTNARTFKQLQHS